MYFLVAQSTYETVQVGFFQDSSFLIDQKIIQKFQATRQLASTLIELVRAHEISVSDLAFVGVNQGPAPFNTLRTMLATVNGFAFATQVPLVSVNGLKALHAQCSAAQAVVLLNAFNNHVYYAYKKRAQLVTGVANIHEILPAILLDIPHGALTFIGNGALLFQEPISATFGMRAQIPDPMLTEKSLEELARICLNKFNQQETCIQAQPLYLKRAV